MTTRIQIIGEVADAESMSRYMRLLDEVREPPTLGSLIEKHGVQGSDAMEVELLDSFQVKQRFSLAPFAHLEPTTYIKIQFISGPVEREFPALEPGAVLLEEYLVTTPED